MYSDEPCIVERGGLFNEQDSTSYTEADNLVAAGGATTETIFKGSVYGVKNLSSRSIGAIDKIKLEGSAEPTKFPFGIPTSNWDTSHTTLSALGLGRNSTYLNALRKAEKITSRVWSIFWGVYGDEKPIDGSLVLGVYDGMKVMGDNYTAPLVHGHFDGSQGCWTGMRVTVTGIKVNFAGGTNASIFPSGTALHCCIDPAHHLLMEAPIDYIENFKSITGIDATHSTTDLVWMALQTSIKKQFSGDLTFYLESRLEIRVPNNQFVFPETGIDKDGSRVYNLTRQNILINNIEDEAPILGRYFLTAAYLMVNQDASTFTLWKANSTEDSKPVRVFDRETAEKCGDEANGVIQPSASATGSTSDQGNTDSNKPSDSIIGGAAAGSVLGISLIALGVYYVWHRYKKQTPKDTYYY
ncbi:hypothetical protein FLAG1_06049 [Fusarium langsethiae]|uniref:Peptidase A1 domain-containing protein n=1 Tax=Fusarium langsethiae TaxID=179993 RepID=A0A0M9EWF3_FUSLA|nr:hypothetical protein FLAG1_06049 [Fusarium langsethiae]GKU00106.1 unnamed protein product [Fusarium langsethiae]